MRAIFPHVSLFGPVIAFWRVSGKVACVASLPANVGQVVPAVVSVHPPCASHIFAGRKCLLHILRTSVTANKFGMIVEFVSGLYCIARALFTRTGATQGAADRARWYSGHRC